MLSRFLLPLGAAVALAGCTPSQIQTREDLAEARIALAASFCERGDDPRCRFVNSPVKTGGPPVKISGRAATFFRTTDSLSFTDGRNSVWLASRDTLTDGASIPLLFVPIVGSPTDPAVVNAAAVHDAHCGIGNEEGPEFQSRTWEETHRMFYDALRVGGTAELKAKVMFAAVYLGGPRWDDPARDLTNADPAQMQTLMKRARGFIQLKNPSVPQIEAYIQWHERDLIRTGAGQRNGAERNALGDGEYGEDDHGSESGGESGGGGITDPGTGGGTTVPGTGGGETGGGETGCESSPEGCGSI